MADGFYLLQNHWLGMVLLVSGILTKRDKIKRKTLALRRKQNLKTKVA
jgi:hypothetical protein